MSIIVEVYSHYLCIKCIFINNNKQKSCDCIFCGHIEQFVQKEMKTKHSASTDEISQHDILYCIQ